MKNKYKIPLRLNLRGIKLSKDSIFRLYMINVWGIENGFKIIRLPWKIMGHWKGAFCVILLKIESLSYYIFSDTLLRMLHSMFGFSKG